MFKEIKLQRLEVGGCLRRQLARTPFFFAVQVAM